MFKWGKSKRDTREGVYGRICLSKHVRVRSDYDPSECTWKRHNKALKTCPFGQRTVLRTSRHRKDTSSGVHVQESYRVWPRNIDPRSKEMYVFYSLGEMSNVHSCGLCVCGGPFLLLCGKWCIPTKLFVPSAMALNLPSPPPADDLKRGNAYFYFGSWFERLTFLSIILFP